jgi:hypothetical protein
VPDSRSSRARQPAPDEAVATSASTDPEGLGKPTPWRHPDDLANAIASASGGQPASVQRPFEGTPEEATAYITGQQ